MDSDSVAICVLFGFLVVALALMWWISDATHKALLCLLNKWNEHEAELDHTHDRIAKLEKLTKKGK